MRPLFLGALAVVVAAATGCGSAATVPGTPAPSTAKKAAEGVRGQITAETGSTWTVTTAKGRAFTVTVDGQTAFGTKATPATSAQFPVGTTVRVMGARHGTAVTATRIALAKNGTTTSTAPSAPAPSTAVP